MEYIPCLHGLQEMMKAALPDAVVIASPTHTHREYVERCLDEGVHILCEKPFVSPEPGDAQSFVEQAIERAGAAGLTVAMNSQWPFSLPAYEELCGKIDAASLKSFYMRLSPQVPGIDRYPIDPPRAEHAVQARRARVIKDITLEKALTRSTSPSSTHASVTSQAARVELRRETSSQGHSPTGSTGLSPELIEPERTQYPWTYGAKNLRYRSLALVSARLHRLCAHGRGPFVAWLNRGHMRCLIEIYRSYERNALEQPGAKRTRFHAKLGRLRCGVPQDLHIMAALLDATRSAGSMQARSPKLDLTTRATSPAPTAWIKALTRATTWTWRPEKDIDTLQEERPQFGHHLGRGEPTIHKNFQG
jgi:hypothetical protein